MRRAVLPWRTIRPSRLDSTPGGGILERSGEPLRFVLAVVYLPLRLPALATCIPALVEVAVEVVLTPFALAIRATGAPGRSRSSSTVAGPAR